MNNLDRLMEYLVAGVFLCVGFRKIWSYRRRPKALGASQRSLPFGLPHVTILAIGLFEIVAALALLVQFGPVPQATLVPLAAATLGLLMIAAGIYHVRRHETAAPTAVLFLLTLFVIVGRW
jgi:DoxX-like protein